MDGRQQEPLQANEHRPFEAFVDMLRHYEAAFASTEPDAIHPQDYQVAIETLDAAWPFNDQMILYSGHAQYVKDGAVVTGLVSGLAGRSAGFTFRKLDQDDRPRLYHMVEQKDHTYWEDDNHRVTRTIIAFVDTAALILPYQALDEIYERPAVITTEVPFDQIEDDSRRFISMLRSTAFRRLSHRRQQGQLAARLQAADTAYDLAGRTVVFEADYCRQPVITADGAQSQRRIDIMDNVFSGVVHGFGSTEQNSLYERAIRRDRDLYDKAAGLCLLVEISQAAEAAPLKVGQVILLPLSSQDPGVHFIDPIDTMDRVTQLELAPSDDDQ